MQIAVTTTAGTRTACKARQNWVGIVPKSLVAHRGKRGMFPTMDDKRGRHPPNIAVGKLAPVAATCARFRRTMSSQQQARKAPPLGLPPLPTPLARRLGHPSWPVRRLELARSSVGSRSGCVTVNQPHCDREIWPQEMLSSPVLLGARQCVGCLRLVKSFGPSDRECWLRPPPPSTSTPPSPRGSTPPPAAESTAKSAPCPKRRPP